MRTAASLTGLLFLSVSVALIRSDNGAQSPQASGRLAGQATALAVDPGKPVVVYAGTPLGLYRSIDGGRTWSEAWRRVYPTGNSESVVLVAVNPQDPQTVYIGTEYEGILKSIDGGRRWEAANRGLGRLSVRQLAINPTHPATMYAATGDPYGDGVFKTTDGGRTWVRSGLAHYFVDAVAVDPRTPDTVYAAYWDPMFANDPEEVFARSTDGGRSWRYPKPGVSTAYISSFAIDRRGTASIYAATRRGILRSTNGGRNWRLAGPPGVSAIEIDPLKANTVYAASQSRGLFRSVNGGRTWSRYGHGLKARMIYSLAISSRSHLLYVGTDAGVYRIATR